MAGQESLTHPALFVAAARRRHEACIGIALALKGRRQPRNVDFRRHQIALLVAEIRLVHGRIELDQNVADPDLLPIVHKDCASHTDLEGLHDLGMTGRDDLALGNGDDIDTAEPGPDDRDRKNSDEAVGPETADRRRRRFDDFERGGQKFRLGAANGLLSGRDDGCGHLALIGQNYPGQDCIACSAEYRPPRRRRSSCEPSSVTRPRSMVRMRSATRTAISRCAMMKTVRPLTIWRMLSWTIRSLS